MKLLTLAILITASVTTHAAYYFHSPSNKMIEAYKFDYELGTAVYFDYADSIKKTVNISDLSKETSKSVNGVKSGSLVLLVEKNHKFCETFHVFENGVAYIGCQSDKIQSNIGMDRLKSMNYFASVELLSAEIKESNEFKKYDRAILEKDAGNLTAGTKVRIEAIFPNGEALIQKSGANLMDTSSLRLKFNVERVPLSDLQKR
jgi:hypothetical protein